jgi:Septum formation
MLAATAIVLLSSCSGEKPPARSATGAVLRATDWSTFDLRAGDCLAPKDDLKGDVDKIPVVPCAESHTQEVFGMVKHPADAFPGVGNLAGFADGKCVGELQQSLGVSPSDGYFVSYLLPSFDSWNKKNDRSVVCVLVFPKDAAKKGSIVADHKKAKS